VVPGWCFRYFAMIIEFKISMQAIRFYYSVKTKVFGSSLCFRKTVEKTWLMM